VKWSLKTMSWVLGITESPPVGKLKNELV